MILCYRHCISGRDRRVAVDMSAQTPDVGPVAVGHHTEVVGVDAEVEDDPVHHVPHRRVHRRTKGTVVTR